MNNVLKTLLAFVALTISPFVWSIPINGTEVGSVDLILAVTNDLQEFNPSTNCPNGSNEAAEECWAEFVETLTLDLEGKTETVPIYYDTAGVLGAFELQDAPEYYIVKNSQTWILMQNMDDFNWGVLDTSDTALDGFMFNLGSGHITISHVTEFNGGQVPPTQVPEPTSIALLGIGLVGFGFSVKRKRNSARG